MMFFNKIMFSWGELKAEAGGLKLASSWGCLIQGASGRVGQGLFEQTRDIVYHIYHPRILHSYWPHHPQAADHFMAVAVGRSDDRTTAQARQVVLRADADADR